MSFVSNSFYLEPGVVGLVSIGMLFVGADVDVLLLPTAGGSSQEGRPDLALTAHGQIGVTF